MFVAGLIGGLTVAAGVLVVVDIVTSVHGTDVRAMRAYRRQRERFERMFR